MKLAHRLMATLSLTLVCSLALGASSPSSATPAAAPSAPAAAPAMDAAAVAAAAAPATIAGHPLERADLESWLDGYMPYALQRGDVGGSVVAVVKNGEVLLTKGYGYSNVEKRTPVDPQRTMFRPGSTSKLFTWTAVMQLVEQGKLDLDHDVNEYLPFKLPSRDDGPITLRHIMTHTAGFEEQIKQLIADDPKVLVPLKDYAKDFTPVRIYKAGSTPAYSNYATALAGFIVEHVSGQSFDDYIDAHIFKPLNMTHSSFRQPLPAAFVPDMSEGYSMASEPAQKYEIVTPAPAGSLASSGEDMAHFMIAHLQGGEYKGERILSAETAKIMHESPTTMIPPLNRMMLGFYEQNYNGHRVISHGGDTQFFHSYLHLFLDDNVGLFVSVNSLGREGAAAAIREALFEQFARRYFPAPPETERVDAATAISHAQAMAGYYEDSRRSETSFMSVVNLLGAVKVVAEKDGRLNVSMMKGLNGATRHYREVKPWVWVDEDSGWHMAAVVADGKVKRFSFDEVSPFMVFEPAPSWRSASWLQPAAIGAIAAVVLTALLWPVAVIVRRRHGVTLNLQPRAARARFVSRVAAVALAVMTIAWVAVIIGGLSSLGVLGPKLDPILFVLHLLSIPVFIGGALALLWSASVAWTEPSPWNTRLWSTVLALSGVVLLWLAFVYHVMSFRSTY